MGERPRAPAGRPAGGKVPSPRGPEAASVEQVPRALRCANQVLFARLRASVQREGLPFGRFIVLRLLVAQGPTTSRKLAEAMGVTSAYLPGLIARLEADGLIRRARSSKDRREILVEPTPKGRRTLLRMKDSVQADMARAFEGWTDRELRTFLRLLQRFTGDLRAGRLVQLKVLRRSDPTVPSSPRGT